ncbi:MAG: DUF1059 domain-containing protein [Anaerolineales bacterium]|jgi:predicted small metal-binding protein
MAELACRDLGMNCDAVIRGSTVEEVKRKAMDHARSVHAKELASMSSPEQMAQMVRLIDQKMKK